MNLASSALATEQRSPPGRSPDRGSIARRGCAARSSRRGSAGTSTRRQPASAAAIRAVRHAARSRVRAPRANRAVRRLHDPQGGRAEPLQRHGGARPAASDPSLPAASNGTWRRPGRRWDPADRDRSVLDPHARRQPAASNAWRRPASRDVVGGGSSTIPTLTLVIVVGAAGGSSTCVHAHRVRRGQRTARAEYGCRPYGSNRAMKRGSSQSTRRSSSLLSGRQLVAQLPGPSHPASGRLRVARPHQHAGRVVHEVRVFLPRTSAPVGRNRAASSHLAAEPVHVTRLLYASMGVSFRTR